MLWWFFSARVGFLGWNSLKIWSLALVFNSFYWSHRCSYKIDRNCLAQFLFILLHVIYLDVFWFAHSRVRFPLNCFNVVHNIIGCLLLTGMKKFENRFLHWLILRVYSLWCSGCWWFVLRDWYYSGHISLGLLSFIGILWCILVVSDLLFYGALVFWWFVLRDWYYSGHISWLIVFLLEYLWNGSWLLVSLCWCIHHRLFSSDLGIGVFGFGWCLLFLATSGFGSLDF